MTSLFPFPQIRDGQKELIKDIETVLETGNSLIAHAPTGIGKTAAALAPCLEYALNNNKIIFFLTSKQSQHRIVIDTLRLIKDKIDKNKSQINFSVVDIISKQAMCPRDIAREYYAVFNEMCIHEQKTRKCRYFRSDKTVTNQILNNILHVEELKDLCAENVLCPHKTAVDAMAEADVVVCDYNYVFTDILETVLEKTGKPMDDLILIIDEAHNLPDRIRDHLSGELTLNLIDEAAKEISPLDKKLHRHIRDVGRFFDRFIETQPGNTELNISREEITQGIEQALQEVLGGGLSYMEFVESLKAIEVEIAEKEQHEKKEKSPLTSIIEFLEGWNTNLPCSRVYRNEVNPVLSFRLLDPSVLSEKIISGAHTAVMMSGTLYPVEMYADILGAKNALLKQYKSPFPSENKLVLITKRLTTLYSMRSDSMYNEMAKKISQIHDAVGGNAAVFFPSYSLMDDVYRKFQYNSDAKIEDKSEDIILEERRMSKAAKNKLFNKLKINSNKILFGVQAGSLSEGIDYKNNILRAVIIAGLPLSPPTLEVKNQRDYYINKFGQEKGILYGYIYPAISKVMQAAGRGIRSENDVGAVILMDARFAYPKYRKCLPPDYDIEITDEAEKICSEFFKKDFVVKALQEAENKIREEKVKKSFERIKVEEVKINSMPVIEKIEDKNLIPLAVLECVYEFNERLGVHKIAGILTGSNAKFIGEGGYNESKNYGVLGNFTAADIAAVIDELLQKDYLERAGEFMYPTVKVSRTGGLAILKKEEIKVDTLSQIKEYQEKEQKQKTPHEEAEDMLTPGETELFEKLRMWRRKLADRNNVPPYRIFQDKTLREVARKKPGTKEELKEIYGVGEAKLEKYGGVLIEIVNG
ncbi:hypothetical protein BEH94_01580 [Candidatus Altiarchaeales archaeon WOR_SM1_SCG]|nr:hypothetical protein BEH94_01580 [Candidatus Altiarchaeales archaeon WOR_SM1_SCG]